MSSGWLESGLPCKYCPSSDAVSLNDEGWYKCFSCGVNYKDSDEIVNKRRYMNLVDGHIQALKTRGISLETCKKWDVSCGYNQSVAGVIFPYKDATGKTIAQKFRSTDKGFQLLGETSKVSSLLFGSWLWPAGSSMKIIITEGELDALSVSQMQGNRYPVVSVPLGASKGSSKITKVLAENLTYLNSFPEIILMFDMDEAGQNEARLCSKLFSPGKCKIASLPLKDANEMVKAGREEELRKSIWNAQPYRPEGILTIDDLMSELDIEPEPGISYPWAPLTEWTYGLGRPEFNVFISGTGMGKTSIYRAIMAHILKEHDAKIGAIFLEETPKDTIIKLAGNMVAKRFDSPLISFDKQDRNDAIESLRGKVFVNDLRADNSWVRVEEKIRHMIVGEGCEYIFLDHLTKFSDGASDPNKTMETICSSISDMCMELNANINCIAHTRKTAGDGKSFEEGGRPGSDDIKGSGAIKQYAWNILSLSRNQQSNDEYKRNISKITLIKCRNAGENVGREFYIRYDPETALLTEEPDMEDL